MAEPDAAAAQRLAAEPIPGLLAAVREDPSDVERVKEFWRAYLALPMWLFIARGTQEQPLPLVLVFDDRPTLLVFSSAEGAKAAGIAAGLSDDEASLVLTMPTEHAVHWAADAAQRGILDLQVDRHLGGFTVPVTAPRLIRARLAGGS